LIDLATKAITVRVDDDVKKQADMMLDDIGINMTTYIVSCLKALIRERKIPFEMVTTQYLTDQIILEKLSEAEKEAADPDTQWLSHEEVFKKIREKFAYEI
jgi:DNA-damage-inducible protein J